MVGTIVNVGAILAGTLVGVSVGRLVPERVHLRVTQGLGLVVLLLGVDTALAWRDTSILYVMGAILLGAIVGELLDLESRVERLGRRIEEAAHRRTGGESPVAEAFVTASLVFCVGPLAVYGAFEDGLTSSWDALATKSLLDGFASIAFAAALGWGVALSAGAVLLVQGAFTLLAGLLGDVLVGEVLASLTSAGGVLLVGIGLRLLDIVDVRVGNFLPALAFAPVIALIAQALGA